MKFDINGMTWKIKEVKQKEFYTNDSKEDGIYYGQTRYVNQEVLIYKELSKASKIRTLGHELCHVYMFTYLGSYTETFSREEVCDIVGNSYNFVNDVIEDYKDYLAKYKKDF